MGCPDSGTTPVMIASGQSRPNAIAIDETDVYWTNRDGGTVMKAPKCGGPVTELASAQDTPTALALDATNVYWTTEGGFSEATGAVQWTPKSMTSVTPLASDQFAPQALAADGVDAFWINAPVEYGGGLWRVPIAGGAAVQLAPAEGTSAALALSGATVYWATNQSDDVKATPQAGGATITLSTGPGTGVTALATDASSIYWCSAGTPTLSYQDGSIMKAPLAGGTAVALASNQAIPHGIAVEDEHVYWVNHGSVGYNSTSGSVMKVSTLGGAATTLASSQGAPRAIAVDATDIFWVNTFEGTVLRLSK
jgi:hypothetical protein